MFVVILTYQKPLTEVDKHLQTHRAFLEEQYQAGALIASGPKNPRNGGVILARAMPREKLDALLAQDPFAIHGIATYEVLEFEPVKHARGFEPFLSPKT